MKIKDIYGYKYNLNINHNFLNDILVSPGWIDIHTHFDEENKFVFSHPDEIGYKTGVTLVVDAGSFGINNIEQIYNKKQNYFTDIKILLNISKIGIPAQNELNDVNNININYDLTKYQNFIIGYKARMSKSVVANNNIRPLIIFNNLRKSNPLPLMVHIGNEPPNFAEIIDLLSPNDIITHTINGKTQSLFTKDGKLTLAMKKAIDKGIKFDLGHGTESFDSKLFKNILKQKSLALDFISTDIYTRNITNGIVKSLATTMNKMKALGMNWKDIINKVSVSPALHFNLENYGAINENCNLTFFKIVKTNEIEVDSKGSHIVIKEKIIPVAVWINGKFKEI